MSKKKKAKKTTNVSNEVLADEVKNGVVETYYDNGQLESRANYENGELNGLRETWYENGQLMTRTHYENGKLNGLCERWDERGNLIESTMYKDDEKQQQ